MEAMDLDDQKQSSIVVENNDMDTAGELFLSRKRKHNDDDNDDDEMVTAEHKRLNLDSDDEILKHFKECFPNVSISSINSLQNDLAEGMKPVFGLKDDTALNLKNFGAFSNFSPKELELRLDNVTVTAKSPFLLFHNQELYPTLYKIQTTFEELKKGSAVPPVDLELGSPNWFYRQYMSFVDNPTPDICFIASIASLAASCAYQNSSHMPDTFSDRALFVALQANQNTQTIISMLRKESIIHSK